MITNIEIINTDDKGRGVFATELISAGETQTSDCIPVSSRNLTGNSPLYLYTFDSEYGKMIALDWTSILNHSDTPNLSFTVINRHQIVFEAIRDIEPGEELTIDYGYDIYEYASRLGISISRWNKITTKEE